MVEPIMTEKQALIQSVRACFDPITASHLSEHALVRAEHIPPERVRAVGAQGDREGMSLEKS